MEKIERDEGIPEYHGSRDQLYKEVEEFEKMLEEETDKIKGGFEPSYHKTTLMEPLQTFETKVAVHTKKNEHILKEKLSQFS